MLTGPFPGELCNCNHVHALYLGYNDFYGPVPNLTAFWRRLTHVILQYNRFNGSIPESIALFPHLYLLNLGNNNFSGGIPPFLFANLTQFEGSVQEFRFLYYFGNIGASFRHELGLLQCCY